jgi:hypothetical protein
MAIFKNIFINSENKEGICLFACKASENIASGVHE